LLAVEEDGLIPKELLVTASAGLIEGLSLVGFRVQGRVRKRKVRRRMNFRPHAKAICSTHLFKRLIGTFLSKAFLFSFLFFLEIMNDPVQAMMLQHDGIKKLNIF
jgi:hypothetical protein